MDTITLDMPRLATHSASDAPLFNRVSLPAPPFDLEIDATRADTAPRSAPIRNKRRDKFHGPLPDTAQYFDGVMDMEGAL